MEWRIVARTWWHSLLPVLIATIAHAAASQTFDPAQTALFALAFLVAFGGAMAWLVARAHRQRRQLWGAASPPTVTAREGFSTGLELAEMRARLDDALARRDAIVDGEAAAEANDGSWWLRATTLPNWATYGETIVIRVGAAIDGERRVQIEIAPVLNPFNRRVNLDWGRSRRHLAALRAVLVDTGR